VTAAERSAATAAQRTLVERRAIPAVGTAVVLWSASSLFVRAGDADALVFSTWRLWFAIPPLTLIVALRSRRGPQFGFWPPGVSRPRWMGLMVLGGASFVAGVVTAFAAIGMTRLLDVTLIGALQPVLVIAFAVAFLGERVSRSHIARAGVAISATIFVAFIASGSGSWSLAGDAVAVLSLFANTVWFLYGRVLRTRFAPDPYAFMLGVMITGAAIITPIAWLHNDGFHMRGVAIGFAACTMVSGTTAHVLMTWAHRFVPTSISSPLLLAEPPLVAVGAWLWFGEAISFWAALGSAVVVASLWGVVRSPQLEHVDEEVLDPAPPT
jgi:drug/metabolite transporter (DMT)-like permease